VDRGVISGGLDEGLVRREGMGDGQTDGQMIE